jgi:hypothetical protein
LRSPSHPAGDVFSDFLRRLEPGREPDPESLRGVLAALERLLRHEMRRRGIWAQPPSRLGVIGFASWREAGALAELAADAYREVILRRLRGLLAQLELKPQVEGLIRRNLKSFLRDLQRGGDPLGYRAWEVAQNAAERAVDRGMLFVVADGPPVGAATLLATRPGVAAAGAGADGVEDELVPRVGAAAEHRRRRLAERAALWNADLLPELVTAGGDGLDEVIERLAHRLPELAADGVESFRLRELVAALRDDLRPRWAARMWDQGGLAEAGALRVPAAGGGEPPVPVLTLGAPPADPEQAAAAREGLRRLRRCVDEGLGDAVDDPRSAGEARAVWRALAVAAVEDDRMPSRRQLAKALDIPRERMPGLFGAIGRVVVRCRRELGLGGEAEEGR